MKILVFSYVFYPESFLVNDLVESLSEDNEITVLTGFPNYPGGDFYPGYSPLKGPYRKDFAKAVVLRYPMCPRKKGLFWLAINYFTHIIGATLSLFRLKEHDLYFVFAPSPLLIAIPAVILKKFRPRPLIIWYQDLWPESFVAVTKVRFAPLIKGLQWITRWIYRNTDVMMIQSDAFRDSLQRHGFRGRTVFVPNWAPDFHRVDQKPEWLSALPESKCLITFAGTVGKAQSLDTLLDAISDFSPRDATFLIVGDGSDRARLESRARELGLSQVIFVGKKNISEMPYVFEQSDFMFASLAKDEIFACTIPAKVQAYMSLGKPLIASIDGEARRIIEEARCGFAAGAENSGDLRELLITALQSSAESRREMGSRARAYYLENFERGKILRRIRNEFVRASGI